MKENSIKEDIERLKLCSTNQCNICGRYEKEECMLERNRCEQHILSDYKRVLQENEYMHNELDKQQTKINKYAKENEELKSNSNDSVVAIKLYSLQKENEQLRTELNSLKENNEELLELANNKQWISPCYVAQNYISKQKIKDKIEEIQEEGYWLFTTDRDSDKCVEFLQELLEKE